MKRLSGLNRWMLVLVLAVLCTSAQAQEPPDTTVQTSEPCATCNRPAHRFFLVRWWHAAFSSDTPDEGKPEREEFCRFAVGQSPEYFRSPPSIQAPLPPERITRQYP